MNSHPTTISRRFSNCLLWMAALYPWLGGNLLADSVSTKNVGPLPKPATVWGVKPARYGLDKPYFMVDNLSGMTQRSQTDSLQVVQIGGSAPANMLWPGEPATIVVQVVNKTGQPLRATGKIDIIQYGLLTSMEDMFQISLRKIADAGSVPVAVDIPAQGFQDLKLELPIPERFGAYALVLDLPGQERLLVASLVRTFKNPPLGDSYRLCMDINNVPALVRLGAAPNRVGFAFRSPGDADYESYYQQSVDKLREFKAAGLPVIVEFGHETPMEGKLQPLGRPRTFIEDRGGKAFNPGKYIGDIAWLPQYDADFKAWVKRVALEFGWPKGPINGIKLWNEPWEGMSIACWGADIPRFREISVAMCEGVEEARREGGVQVMLGGCDSTANTFDKYFSDGKDDFLKRLDFVSIHYQGLSPVAGVKSWVHRKGPDGQPSRVKIWDTESWCANSDDRIAGTLAAMYAAGHDRLVGIHSQHVVASESEVQIRTATGTERRKITQAWPVAPAVGALQHFIGNREFDRILFPGLPWVFAFKGNPGKGGLIDADDGTLVIVGDITPVFGQGNVLFRNVRSQEDVAAVQPLYRQLAALPVNALERVELERKLARRAVYRGGTMVLADRRGRYGVFDEYGNPMPAKDGKLVVPISDRGYYLRANGQPGSFAELLQAVHQSRIEGFQPVHFIAHDLTRPLSDQSVLRVDVVNSLNRPVTGVLQARLGKLKLRPLDKVTLAPHERRTLELRPEHAEAEPSNEYPLSLEFDAGADGLAFHYERMHVNFIARRTITVDGRLDDWQGVLPQTISSDGTINRTEAEVAWKPFEPFSQNAQKGLATAYLAHDDQYFYFAAKVADDTPDGGTMRFETRDDDSFFFPEKVWQTAKSGGSSELVEVTWPAGVRRYSYAKNPYLPAGNSPNFDNIQIGFNAVPDEEKPWYSHPPGTFPGYAGYFCTDYEYALNQVAPAYGGGTEIWRLRHPKLPFKHFYPRQPKAPFEGPVREGRLVMRHEGRSRIVECAIPWGEIPHVKARRDAGQTLKFTFRVNDSAGVGCLELAKERSVSKQNNFALLVRWTEHWANEVEFGFEKTDNGNGSR